MNPRILQAMMMIVEWDDRDAFCDGRKAMGCAGCPYDLGKGICDKTTTTYVLKYSAKKFREYFNSFKK